MGSHEIPPPPAMVTDDERSLPPHVLIFPLPLQGHVNSMLKLAELLCMSGLHVTVLLSDHTHGRLLRNADVVSRFGRYKGFRFAAISDGLPDDHPRAGERAMDIMMSLKIVGESQFRNLMESTERLRKGIDGGGDEVERRGVTCLIMDGILSFAARVCDEMGIPFIYFRTIGGCSFWANFCIPDVIDAAEVPLKGKEEDKERYWKREDMDMKVTSVAGMEGFLRRRDLPGFFRTEDVNDPGLQTISTETRSSTRARALILNTFEDLEGPILNQIRRHIPKVFSIGPLHAHLKARIATNPSVKEPPNNHSGSFWQEDRSCITWLDAQPHKSVVYVSFGSVAIMTKGEILEIWYGLVSSDQRFLWVMRPDSIIGEDGEKVEIPPELEEGTKARGYMVGWAPQEEVLMHPATGAFLTHSGWNSTLESIFAGVPMICWPYFADQMMNSRFVSEEWRVGLDMKDTCNRGIVEKMVRELMEVRKDEFLKRADLMARLARKAVGEGGTSFSNLDRLIEFVGGMIA